MLCFRLDGLLECVHTIHMNSQQSTQLMSVKSYTAVRMLLFFSSAFHCSHSYTYSVSIWPRTFSSHILDFGPTLTSSCPFSVLFFLAMPLHLPIYPPEPLKEGQLVQLLGGCGGVRGATAPICLWRGRWPSTCSPAPTPPQGQASSCRPGGHRIPVQSVAAEPSPPPPPRKAAVNAN